MTLWLMFSFVGRRASSPILLPRLRPYMMGWGGCVISSAIMIFVICSRSGLPPRSFLSDGVGLRPSPYFIISFIHFALSSMNTSDFFSKFVAEFQRSVGVSIPNCRASWDAYYSLVSLYFRASAR